MSDREPFYYDRVIGIVLFSVGKTTSMSVLSVNIINK